MASIYICNFRSKFKNHALSYQKLFGCNLHLQLKSWLTIPIQDDKGGGKKTSFSLHGLHSCPLRKEESSKVTLSWILRMLLWWRIWFSSSARSENNHNSIESKELRVSLFYICFFWTYNLCHITQSLMTFLCTQIVLQEYQMSFLTFSISPHLC